MKSIFNFIKNKRNIIIVFTVIFFVLLSIEFGNLYYKRFFYSYKTIFLSICFVFGGISLLIGREIFYLINERKKGLSGSKFYIKVVGVFSALVMGPSIIMAVFAVIFFESGLQAWFHTRVKTALHESQNVAQAYLSEHQKVIEQNITSMTQGLNAVFDSFIYEDAAILKDPKLFFQYHKKELGDCLTMQTSIRSLGQAIIFFFKDGERYTVAHSRFSFALEFKAISPLDIEKAKKDGIMISLNEEGDHVVALVPIFAPLDAFLLVSKPVDQKVLQRVTRASKALEEYNRLLNNQNVFAIQFIILFSLFTLVLLLLAIWGGLIFAKQFIHPIGDLINAAGTAVKGNSIVSVPCGKVPMEELRTLIHTFNKMVEETHHQKKKLLEFNEKLQERTHFIENILSGISSGVLSLTKKGDIILSNEQARTLLYRKMQLEEKSLESVVNEFLPIFNKALKNPGMFQEEQVVVSYLGKIFLVHVLAEIDNNEVVLTFDDISELVAAQKKAAWSDVARRIAHEIKNPLTPILLSAERLKRKYQHQFKENDIFQKCTTTIIRQVEYIGKLISEFSAFARMPTPVFKKTCLNGLLKEAVFLQQQAFPLIELRSFLSEESVYFSCDVQQMQQVFTNLLKNAAESIEERKAQESGLKGIIEIRLSNHDGKTELTICDNGTGFSENMMELLDPYITSKPDGSGLGLPIVKKILEDHRINYGESFFLISRNDSKGACIKILFHKNF